MGLVAGGCASAPRPSPRRILVVGLSLTSSWGNGHATTFRSLLRGLAERGHDVRFLERDVPWYAENRDLPDPDYCAVSLYRSVAELRARHAAAVRAADLVLIGSYVPDGVEVADWLLATARGAVAFYDIDTPVTLAALEQGACTYLTPQLVPRFDAYFSFAGGPVLERLERRFGARRALPLLCSVDPRGYEPWEGEPDLDLGYLGTYSADRQPSLERLLLEPARRWPEGRFAVAGPQYPRRIAWPPNVARDEHLPPAAHRRFYGRQRYTLNLTRADMVANGHAPSVRLFEAAACGTPVISDAWPGIDELFEPEREIFLASGPERVEALLRELPEARRREVGRAARARVMAAHTGWQRAAQLERALGMLPPHAAAGAA